MSLFFQPFFLQDANEANVYIVGCSESKIALMIDAGGDLPDYDRFLASQDARFVGIYLTHLHWDHDGGLDSILARHNVPVYSLTGRTQNGKSVTEGDSIHLGQVKTRVVKTTGHTNDSSTLIVNERIAFVGDAIFAGSIGGTSSARAQQEEQDNIQQKIFTLPDDTLICPGHGPITTVGVEKSANPFFV